MFSKLRIICKQTVHVRPLECMLRPGEVLYVPAGWWHTVLNLSPTIAYTETYAGAAPPPPPAPRSQAPGAVLALAPGPVEHAPPTTAQQVVGELQKRTETPWQAAAAAFEKTVSGGAAAAASKQGRTGTLDAAATEATQEGYWGGSMPRQCLLELRAAYPRLFGGSPRTVAASGVYK